MQSVQWLSLLCLAVGDAGLQSTARVPDFVIISGGITGADSGALRAAALVNDRRGAAVVTTEGFWAKTTNPGLPLDEAFAIEHGLVEKKTAGEKDDANAALADFVVTFRPDATTQGCGTEKLANRVLFGIKTGACEFDASKKAAGPMHMWSEDYLKGSKELPKQFKNKYTLNWIQGVKYPSLPEQEGGKNVFDEGFSEEKDAIKSGTSFILKLTTIESGVNKDKEFLEKSGQDVVTTEMYQPENGVRAAAEVLHKALHDAMTAHHGSRSLNNRGGGPFKIVVAGSADVRKNGQGMFGFEESAEMVLYHALMNIFAARDKQDRRKKIMGVVLGIVFGMCLLITAVALGTKYYNIYAMGALMPLTKTPDLQSQEAGIEMLAKS